jgi:ligand-binding sensor domain-containing protein/signal transduction histidine kinase
MLSAIAGAAEQSDSPFIVDVWSNKEGLPQSSVISVIQTRDGYLWLGTLKGLVRFDGNRFTIFDENNTPGLPSGRIVHLFEDSRTNLWIGTDTAGVALVREGTITNLLVGRDGQEGRLMSVCEDSAGAVWFYTVDADLARYQNRKIDKLSLRIPPPKIESGQPSAFCRTVVAEKSGALWIGEVSGMFAFHSAGFQPPALVFDQTIPAAQLDFLLASARGGVWRLMDGRVQKWNSNRPEKDFGIYPWSGAPVACACEDYDGNLIVGTLGDGIFWYDASGKFQHISTGQGLSSAFVLSLCVDTGGNLWVGTDGEGLNRIKKKTFNSPGGEHSWVAQSVAEDNNGGLWMTLNALGGFRGASYLMGNSVQDFSVGTRSNPRTVLVDRKQRVWVGTGGDGLFQLQMNRFMPVPGAAFPGLQILTLFEDRVGQLWVGTQSGLACWNGQSWKSFTTRDGLLENTITAIAEDADGNLWIGTESRGLNLFKAGKFISYQSKSNELPGNGISALYVDDDGALWVGTSGHGLAQFHNGKWALYSTDNGLASNHIAYIIEDTEGYLWLGSNAGLMRIKKSSLNDFASGATKSILCRTYGETDGLATRECSFGSQPAAYRTRDGKLWFPTVKGLVSVNPKDLIPNLQPPVVLIESVLVAGQKQKTNLLSSTWRQSIIVPPGREQLEIHYTALNFSAPKEVRFRYRLEGRETRWTEAADTRVAYYSDVPPGHYYFHVKACNEDGVWNEAGSVLEIEVQPFFWQTRWFFFVVIACLLGLIVASVRYVSTQKLQRQLQWLKQQEALERERSRIARDLHDQLGANLTQVTLLSEMAEADKDSPAEIESHTQQISQTARETTRSLDEIVWAVNPSNDTLEGLINYACKYAQDYLATAQLRYRVDVPNDLPAIGIPPEVRHNVFLAFKEAVNNVVKHAQASEVWIRLRLQPDNFTLEIEDNGRGIGGLDTGAAQMRNGLRNMRRRMEDIHGEFSISSGTNGGTIVRLTIPFGKQVV